MKANPKADPKKGGSFTKDPKTGEITCVREPTSTKAVKTVAIKATKAEK